MNRNYRIEDKRNVTLNGVKATLFTIYHREPHQLLGSAFVYQGACAFVYQGAYAGVGHDLTDEECLKAFEETPDDC